MKAHFSLPRGVLMSVRVAFTSGDDPAPSCPKLKACSMPSLAPTYTVPRLVFVFVY